MGKNTIRAGDGRGEGVLGRWEEKTGDDEEIKEDGFH